MHGQVSVVFLTRFSYRHRRNRNATRHLNRGLQCIETIQRSRIDRYTDHRTYGGRRDHPRQLRGHASVRNMDLASSGVR